jgi:hypothetical protein
MAFENRVLRRIFGLKRDELTSAWRKLYNDELRDFHSLPRIIIITKSRRMRWAGHEERMGRRGTRVGYCGKTRGKNAIRKTKT